MSATSAVFEDHVQQRVIFGVLVFRADKALVLEGGQTRDGMRARGDDAGRIGLPSRARPSLRFR